MAHAETFIEHHCAFIDWKEEIDEAVYQLTMHFPDYKSIFENEDFIKLIENYSVEDAEEFLPAIGQELSRYDLVLYEIYEDSDRICLYICRKDNSAIFEKDAKTKKMRLTQYKQSRKKWGEPARLLKLANRLPYELYRVEDVKTFTYPFSVAEGGWIRDIDNMAESIYIGGNYVFLDLQTFPPKEKSISLKYLPAGIHYYDYSSEHKLYCAGFRNVSVDENRKGKYWGTIKITADPFDMDSWEDVKCEDYLDELSVPVWIGDDVVILYENKAWIIQDAAHGGRECRKLWETPKKEQPARDEFYPELIEMSDGKRYVFANGYFLSLEYKEKKSSGSFSEKTERIPELKPLFELDEPINCGAASFEKNKFVYIHRGFIKEIDITTGNLSRTFELEKMNPKVYNYISKLNDEWLAVIGVADKNYDLAQFWNFKTGEKLKMKFGNLGKFAVRDIIEHPDGYTLINVSNSILKVDNMLNLLRK
ncbi:hypothetical protein E4O03_11010 [Treponema sp. OMZ 792]|uniref:DUF6630 family protein n=1 Tax=unclassified Treponema TaxID=2638727 RepID=UPI0020A4D89E|nr:MULTISPECIES: hypothetical protein [unclassified Treponema]UTC74716.1 hypothetical protein E4O03_11010 [Treponema sp. OMZ 792]UTC81110.1 hypothetical protein E4O07_10910 [Treponema sp. OMZ 798]